MSRRLGRRSWSVSVSQALTQRRRFIEKEERRSPDLVLGMLQWECLAFFVEWSLNFLKFILFSSVVSFLLKGCRGTFASTRKVAGFWIVGQMGGLPPPGPVGFCQLGVRRMEVRETGTGRGRVRSQGVGGRPSRAILDIYDSLVSLTPSRIPSLPNLRAACGSPESLARVGGASTGPQTPCLLQRLCL